MRFARKQAERSTSDGRVSALDSYLSEDGVVMDRGRPREALVDVLRAAGSLAFARHRERRSCASSYPVRRGNSTAVVPESCPIFPEVW